MSTCRDRLKKLVKVQELKALHETRHATFLASAETEAEELVGHFVRERFDRERLDIIAQRRGHE